MSDQEIVDFNKNVNESFDLLAPDDIIGKDSNSKKSDTNQNVIAAKRNKKKKQCTYHWMKICHPLLIPFSQIG